MMQFVFKTCSFAVVSSQACWVKCYTHDNLRCFFKDFSLAGVGDDFRFHLVFVACLVKKGALHGFVATPHNGCLAPCCCARCIDIVSEHYGIQMVSPRWLSLARFLMPKHGSKG